MKTIAYIILTLVVLSLIFVDVGVKADPPTTLPPYESGLKRVEHDSINVDTTRCVHLSVSVANDAGLMVAADGGLPSSELSYICTVPGSENDVCLSQLSSRVGETCNYSLRIAAGSMTYPISFLPDGITKLVKIYGISSTGTSDVTCCPIIPRIANGR